MIDDTVERLYQRLTEALQRSRPDAFKGPVTVAEIYQELVPYRAVRGEVGFDMNADYEHALLRLLAGEGSMARLEPAHAREHITKELRSTNPNVSIYREYAGCDVFVNEPEAGRFAKTGSLMDDVLSDDETPDPSPWDDVLLLENEDEDEEDALPFSLVDHEPEAQPQPKPKAAATPERAAPPRPPAAAPRPPAPRETSPVKPKPEPPAEPIAALEPAPAKICPFCDSALPGHRPVRFCPYCGQDLTAQPCPTCGETMEAGWMFCVSCGTSRDTP
jgi:hypothetical protein